MAESADADFNLRDLNDQVKLLGLDLGLGGEMPPQGDGSLR